MERELLEKKLKVIEKAIEKLETRKNEISNKIKEIEIEEWKKRKEDGWVPFVFFSSYYGSECNVGDTKLFYVFAPTIFNIDSWKNVEFSHGDSTESETNKKFEEFIDSIKYADYDFLDDDIVEAVWPELYQNYKRL